MEKPISQGLKNIFLVHAIISGLLGLCLWFIPGRFLTLLGWVPQWVILADSDVQVPGTTFIDAFITRLLGAALLALAYSSVRGWRMSQWGDVALVVQLESVFCILGLVSMIWSLIQITRSVPSIGYVLIVVFTGFFLAWFWALRSHTKRE